MPLNSPLPVDLEAECRKAARTLSSFIDGSNDLDKAVIPHFVLAKAKGLAILTVIKAGFLWSGRIGSGIVVSRLSDGTWSAPSAIGTAGVGVGGQIGAELTDFVIVLNTEDAVKAFSRGGNVTLGGSLSVAAGPVGRTAEASGTVANLAAVFSYSKSRGLFAGISIEGSVIVERHDANAKFYGRRLKASEILSGTVQRPAAAMELYRALEKHTSVMSSVSPTTMATVASMNTSPVNNRGVSLPDPSLKPPAVPPRSVAVGLQTVVALYDFEGQQPGDLSFRAGDTIEIVRRTPNKNDWWTGKIGERSGQFPANYVQ